VAWSGTLTTLTRWVVSSFNLSLCMWTEQLSIKRIAGSFSSPGLDCTLPMCGRRIVNIYSFNNIARIYGMSRFLSMISIPIQFSASEQQHRLLEKKQEKDHVVATSW
jgi:hypothetical protein